MKRKASTELKSLFTESDLYREFQAGDLLYGLAQVRNLLRSFLVNKIGQTPIVIDEFNSALLHRFCNNEENYEFDDVNSEDYIRKISELNENLKQHLYFLQSNLLPEKLRIQKVSEKNIERNLNQQDIKTRRACKAGLFKPFSPCASSGKMKIHFCLDGIDMNHVLDRKYSLSSDRKWPAKYGRCLYDSFTAAEMRFIKKNYHLLKGNIIFYLQGEIYDLQENPLPWQVVQEELALKYIQFPSFDSRIFNDITVRRAPPPSPRRPSNRSSSGRGGLFKASFSS